MRWTTRFEKEFLNRLSKSTNDKLLLKASLAIVNENTILRRKNAELLLGICPEHYTNKVIAEIVGRGYKLTKSIGLLINLVDPKYSSHINKAKERVTKYNCLIDKFDLLKEKCPECGKEKFIDFAICNDCWEQLKIERNSL